MSIIGMVVEISIFRLSALSMIKSQSTLEVNQGTRHDSVSYPNTSLDYRGETPSLQVASEK